MLNFNANDDKIAISQIIVNAKAGNKEKVQEILEQSGWSDVKKTLILNELLADKQISALYFLTLVPMRIGEANRQRLDIKSKLLGTEDMSLEQMADVYLTSVEATGEMDEPSTDQVKQFGQAFCLSASKHLMNNVLPKRAK